MIDAGTISVAADTNLGAAPGSAVADQLTLSGGTLQTTATFTQIATIKQKLNKGGVRK